MRFVFLLFLTLTVSAQKLHHQAISSLGLSTHSVNGLSIKQSVGQQSVIGNSTANNLFLGQGFLQGKFTNFKSQPNISLIETSIYPNPFFDKINFQFSNIITGLISISIYDITGKLIFSVDKQSSNNLLSIDQLHFPEGEYLVKLSADNYNYSTIILRSK